MAPNPKNKLLQYVKWFLLVMVAVLIAVCIVFLATTTYYARHPSQEMIGEITDVAEYTTILEAYGNSKFIQHFPQSIPSDATNPKLHFHPRIMQGAEVFQLRLKLPNNHIQSEKVRFAESAEFVFTGLETPDTFFLPYLWVSDDKTSKFPPHFTTLVLKAVPAGNPEQEWNHGYMYGVSISESTLEIVYWFEYW